MSIISIVNFFTALLSIAILALGGYLLWSWQAGELVREPTGALHRVREDWRLWCGLGLLAWSFLGRFIVLALVAKPDLRKTGPERSAGQTLTSPTGSSLYVENHGPDGAPPIIFTHGWGMDSTFWRYAREDLQNRFRLIVWDLPGLGRSRPSAKQGIGLEAFAADLAEVIDAGGGHKPVLVGHSIGGMIIQTLMRDQPTLQNRIGGLVLLNTTYTNPLKTMIFSKVLQRLERPVLKPSARLAILLQPLVWLAKWQSYLSGSSHLAHRLGFGRFVTRSQLEHTTLLMTRNPPAALARGDLAMFDWDATGALDRTRIPVLVIGGDKDIVTKPDASRIILAENDMATLHLVEGVNHMGPMERAGLYDEMIADFVLHVQPGVAADLTTGAPAAVDEAAPRPDVDHPGRPSLH